MSEICSYCGGNHWRPDCPKIAGDIRSAVDKDLLITDMSMTNAWQRQITTLESELATAKEEIAEYKAIELDGSDEFCAFCNVVKVLKATITSQAEEITALKEDLKYADEVFNIQQSKNKRVNAMLRQRARFIYDEKKIVQAKLQSCNEQLSRYESATCIDTRMELTSFFKDGIETSRLLLTLPADLIGKRVKCIILEEV